jgi:nucleotide sugar dehydrogenase
MVIRMKFDKEEIKEKIAKRTIRLSVVGLGYVGLNIACLFAKNGFVVCGFDINEEKIGKLRNHINPIPEERWLTPYIERLYVSTDVESAALLGDIIFVAVPTPFNDSKTDLTYLKSALRSVRKTLEGKILVIESTAPPGTAEKLVRTEIEEVTGFRAGEDFGFAHSPERIDPSNNRNFIWNTPKVVGGINPVSTEIVTFAYSQVVEKVIPVLSPRTAEFVKVIENTQRNVNIALVNLYAKAADKLNIDIEEALIAASTKWNFIKLTPGCGVGGECIDDSACMLAEVMDELNLDSTLVKESSKINRSMPEFTIKKLCESSRIIGKNIEDIELGLLGLAYKGNSSDIRNSPSLKLIERLKKMGCVHITAYDPLVSDSVEVGVQRVKTLKEALAGVDSVIIAADHSEFKNMDTAIFMDAHVKVIIDGRNCLDKEKVTALGIIYKGIGR